ncbi:hypothetical protein NW767_012007 [Fusarium falciforme]|nr:hypothetical protein NW767_012007 [Fusarium falciforme]
MHGLLAVSALHYAQHHPGQRKEYILISSHYQNLALKIFAVKLQDINEENIEPYFYLATFIFILSLCSIAERQDSPSPVTPSEIAQSFMLLQGAKSIYEFKSTEIWSRDGPLAPLVEQDQPQALPAKQTGAFHDRMDQLYALARGLSPTLDAINEKSSCLLAIESLRTIHSSCSADRSPSRARRIWLWPISLTHIFLELLSSSHYVALIILAHYAALAKPFENKHWMNQDWSANVMASVERTLEDKWQEWIAWPKRSIEQEINVDEMSP